VKTESFHQDSPVLSVNHLSVSFLTDQGPLKAVDDVSFTLYPRKTLFIVGESGSGKSVLCKSILRLLPDNIIYSKPGTIVFDSQNLTSLSEKKLNQIRGRRIAMIFQDPMSSLNPVMKIGIQVAETLVYHLGMTLEEAMTKAGDLLSSVGIGHPTQRLDQYPHQLSGGLRQRVAIAAAIACNPHILIADEPTSALDVTVQTQILDLLYELKEKNDMAMILVTHDLGLAAGRADDIAVMYAGNIVEYATAENIFKGMRMPYTRDLIASIPKIEDPPHTPLTPIEGQPPDPMDAPAGCSYAPRCKQIATRCMQDKPPLRSAGQAGHLFACWNPVEKVAS